ncbi:MAG: Ig-like domain-containing protein [Candidatus Zixiibacteriota bacterium]
MSDWRWTAVRLISLAFIIVLLSCAKVASPPGGPEDKTAPTVLGTLPVGNATSVTRDNRISIQFSESIEKKTVENAVIISPGFPGKIKYNWDHSTLNIILPDSFADSTTYVVNVGSDIADLRRNKMESSFIFAFSTGTRISQGKVTGTVRTGGKPAAGAMVALFNMTQPDAATAFDSLYPPYITQSGKSGEYSLEFLPEGRFFIMAFMDKNKDHLFDYPAEPFGLPDKICTVSGLSVPTMDFNIIQEDTAAVSVISSGLTGDRLVKMRLSKSVKSDIIKNNLDKIFLIPIDAADRRITPVAVKEKADISTQSFSFFFESLAEGKYNFEMKASIFNQNADSATMISGGELNVIYEPDKTPPSIEDITHSRKMFYPSDSIMTIWLSEPLDTKSISSDAIRVMDADSNRLSTEFVWPDRFTLDLYASGIDWGKVYDILVAESLLYDLSGNRMGDTILNYKFTTYNKDSLGSASGEIVFGPGVDSAGVVHITFATEKGLEILSQSLRERTFNVELPPGKYLMKGYLDRNDNNSLDLGKLYPFDFAEKSVISPDTVRVRARFETSGIIFKID